MDQVDLILKATQKMIEKKYLLLLTPLHFKYFNLQKIFFQNQIPHIYLYFHCLTDLCYKNKVL